jgi:hypothetical protein
MSESDLTTAAFCPPLDEADWEATSVESLVHPCPASTVSGWERANARLSRVLAFAIVVIATVLAIGYVKSARSSASARSKKSTSPIDWLLWFGGAKPDQTFEKYIKDTTEKNQREWDEKYRDSPASKLGQGGIDWSKMQ